MTKIAGILGSTFSWRFVEIRRWGSAWRECASLWPSASATCFSLASPGAAARARGGISGLTSCVVFVACLAVPAVYPLVTSCPCLSPLQNGIVFSPCCACGMRFA